MSVPSGSLLGISCAGQMPVQTSSGAAAGSELADPGRMAAVRTTARASSILLVALALVGCGGKQAPDAPTDEVFAGWSRKARRRTSSCEPVGAEVRGEPVVGCSFEEERNASGVMRAVDRCFVVRDGVLIDVTREVPVGTSCAVSSP